MSHHKAAPPAPAAPAAPAAAGLPQLLGSLTELVGSASRAAADAGGALWKLEMSERQLDANVVRLRPAASVAEHVGPDLDVLMVVVGGSGRADTAEGELTLDEGALLWLPRRSRRAIHAGPDGLTYLTVHPRRAKLQIGPRSGG